jgi:hypothetical protein
MHLMQTYQRLPPTWLQQLFKSPTDMPARALHMQPSLA